MTSFLKALKTWSNEEVSLPESMKDRLGIKHQEYRRRIEEFFQQNLSRTKTDSHSLPPLEVRQGRREARDHYFDACYKMELSKMLLAEGHLEMESARQKVIALGIPFEPEIFRNAYGVMMDYCTGRLHLPKTASHDIK